MADTGYKVPSATGSIYNQCSYPTRAYVLDNSYAYCSSSSLKQSYNGFDISIPAGSTIDGIVIEHYGYFDATSGGLLFTYITYNNGDNWVSQNGKPCKTGNGFF